MWLLSYAALDTNYQSFDHFNARLAFSVNLLACVRACRTYTTEWDTGENIRDRSVDAKRTLQLVCMVSRFRKLGFNHSPSLLAKILSSKESKV